MASIVSALESRAMANVQPAANSSQSSTSSTSTSSSSSLSSLSGAASEQTFLQLLVAQIKNQDPLSPTDSTQFVTQLAQFSELEQSIGIKGDMDTLLQDIASGASTPTTTTTTPNAAAQTAQSTTNTTGGIK
jgi:flagellar basal-body rod modification protein FlgD